MLDERMGGNKMENYYLHEVLYNMCDDVMNLEKQQMFWTEVNVCRRRRVCGV